MEEQARMIHRAMGWGGGMNHFAFETPTSAPALSSITAALFIVFSFVAAALCLAADSLADAAEQSTEAVRTKQELIQIMKTVNFVPQLGADDHFCKSFYEDFKKQTNIEHIQSIAKADKYDDPAFQPYQSKCPKLKMHKHYGFYPRDMELGGPPESEEEAESRALEISTGLKNFQLFKVDINNNPKDGEEYLFYHEGEFEKRSNQVYPANRAYQVVDLATCRITDGIYFRGGSEQWNRNGVIRYKGKNAIYEPVATSQPEYFFLTLHLYSEKLGHVAPACTYHKPR